VFVRKSSSYFEHLQALNERFAAAGKPPVKLREAPDELEDEDLMEMVNAGLVPIVVVDDYKARCGRRSSPASGSIPARPSTRGETSRGRCARTARC